jgi:uncharacterized membrane protein HdeD (DUF308 family)
MILFGVLLLLPGICFAYFMPRTSDGAVAIAALGLVMIVGGIVWLAQAVRARP